MPLKIDGIGNGHEGYVEIDVPTVTIRVRNFHDGSRVVPTLRVIKDINGSVKSYSATLNGVNLDDYITIIQAEFGIKD